MATSPQVLVQSTYHYYLAQILLYRSLYRCTLLHNICVTVYTDSPNSGHKEMSTESLALQYQKSNMSYWQNVLNGELIFSARRQTLPAVRSVRLWRISRPSQGVHSLVVLLITRFSSRQWTHHHPCPSQDASGNTLELKPKLPRRLNSGTPNRTETPNVLFKAQRARSRTTQFCFYGHPKVITYFPYFTYMTGSMVSQNSKAETF